MSICGGSRIGCEDTWRNSLRSWFSGVVGASRSTPRKIARQSLERHETGQTTRSRSGEQNGRLGVGRTTHAWSCSRCGVAFGFHRASFFPPFECPCLSSALLSGESPRLLPRNSRPPETGPPGARGRSHRTPPAASLHRRRPATVPRKSGISSASLMSVLSNYEPASEWPSSIGPKPGSISRFQCNGPAE